MAGVMYLGNQMVSPVIIQGGDDSEKAFATYKVSNGVASQNKTLTGDEFDNIIEIADNGMRVNFQSKGLSGPVNFKNLISVGFAGLDTTFSYNPNITSVSMPSLKSISDSGMSYAFSNCSGIESVDLSSLETVGDSGLLQAFLDDYSLNSVNLSSLKTVADDGLADAFDRTGLYGEFVLSSLESVGWTGLSYTLYETEIESLKLTSLSSIGNYGLMGVVAGCKKLSSMYFNSLKTSTFATKKNQLQEMFDEYTSETSGSCTVHFPSNLQSTIATLIGYPTFGGNSSRIILAFDLSETS